VSKVSNFQRRKSQKPWKVRRPGVSKAVSRRSKQKTTMRTMTAPLVDTLGHVYSGISYSMAAASELANGAWRRCSARASPPFTIRCTNWPWLVWSRSIRRDVGLLWLWRLRIDLIRLTGVSSRHSRHTPCVIHGVIVQLCCSEGRRLPILILVPAPPGERRWTCRLHHGCLPIQASRLSGEFCHD
jgi:hypothetical protein